MAGSGNVTIRPKPITGTGGVNRGQWPLCLAVQE